MLYFNLQFSKRHIFSLLLLLVSIGLLSLNLNFLAISPPYEFIQNFAHILIFLFITLAIYKALPVSKYRIVMTFTIATVISFTTEVFQFFGARDADILDILLNFSGIAMATSWFLSKRTKKKTNKYFFTISLLFLIGITTSAFTYKCSSALYKQYQLRKMLPFISDFETEWELVRWESDRNAEMSLSNKQVTRGKFSLQVNFQQSSFPRICSHSIPKDWSKYNRFLFDIINPQDEIIPLKLKFVDNYTNNDKCFGRILIKLMPGINSIDLSLNEIRNSIIERNLNIQNIRGVTFYLSDPPKKYTLFFDNIRFE